MENKCYSGDEIMRTIIFMHQIITNHDAIGNDIARMYQLLAKDNVCYAYAESQLNTDMTNISIEDLKEIVQRTDTILIYHHSGYWEQGEEILDVCKCRLVIRYHNITPPEFFEAYNDVLYLQCKKGREQTNRFMEKYQTAIWLSDSEYNQRELHNVAESQLFICPPFHRLDRWKEKIPNENVLQQLRNDKRLQILSVGRVVPNKGYLFMLKVLSCYCENYDQSVILRIVGRTNDLLKKYSEEIQQYIRCYELEDNVQFVGEITDSSLLAYYLGSDVFLCTSEHEGFCVPVLEAQACDLPVLARNLCAVPDTLGKEQLLFDEDVREYAAALHELGQNQELADYVKAQGKINYETNYTNEIITKRFMEFWLRLCR